MMKRSNKILDQIFKSRLKNAKAAPPDGAWEEIKRKRNARPYHQSLFNGWRMLFWLFLAVSSVSLGGGFVSQENNNQKTEVEPEKNEYFATADRNAVISSSGTASTNNEISSSLIVNNQVSQNGKFATENKSGDPDDISKANFDEAKTQVKDKTAGAQDNTTTEVVDKKDPGSAGIQGWGRADIIPTDGFSSISFARNGLEFNPEVKAGEHSDDYFSHPLHSDNWHIALKAGAGLGGNHLRHFGQDHFELTNVEHQMSLDQSYTLSLSAGKHFSSRFFIEGGLSYSQVSLRESYIEREEVTEQVIDTVFDGQIVYPDRDPERHTEVDTSEERSINEHSENAIHSTSYFGIPLRAGYKFNRDMYNLEITAGGRAGFFRSPDMKLGSENHQKSIAEMPGVAHTGGYNITWNWSIGVQGEYYLSNRYSIVAGINSYIPMNNGTDGLSIDVEQLKVTPQVQIRYNF